MTAFRAAFKAYRMHQVLIMPRFARLTIALGLATAVFPVDAEYYFNPRFLSNDLAESVDLSAFTKGREAPPGTYRVDIYLNDEFMYSVQVGNTHGGNTSSGTSGYSSLNYRGAYGNTNVGYSRSGDSSQIYYGMSGGIIAHADGITFGQPLGDTMVLVKAPGADNVKIENQTGIHTDWRGYAILPFATEYRENRVALNANSLADNVELDETVVTVIPTHGAIARATFNAQIGGKVLMTLKYGNKSVPFGAIVTHGENKNGSIVAENGQVYLTGLPQSGQLQVSWGKDKNSNCIVEYKLPEVSPGTLLNQQTAICR
ncbi:fimbria/pilus outer membrane usher protein [Escherichia coli]|uniref:fimbria/pilus outer membrane usher protein n=2 Tax=Escherichia coli TaxID=562 RepID=UPI00098CB783|nr:fimbria/pilus outer membrane usher protein [Escherichia coli]